MLKFLCNLTLSVFYFFILSVCFASANTITYNGILTDSKGNLLDKTVKIRFAIHNSDDEILWKRERFITVTDGNFSIKLGQTNPIPTSVYDGKHSMSISLIEDESFQFIKLRRTISPIDIDSTSYDLSQNHEESNVQAESENSIASNPLTYKLKSSNASISNDLQVKNYSEIINDNSGWVAIQDDLNIYGGKIRFLDSTGNNQTDEYYFEKTNNGDGDNQLKLVIQDNENERFEIWGNGCKTQGGCGENPERSHFFQANGLTYHKGPVGIGVENPSSNLDVNGKIKSDIIETEDINLNGGKIRFVDNKGDNQTDEYYFEKTNKGDGNNQLKLVIQDNENEKFEIWGNGCKTPGGCGANPERSHFFQSNGKTYHKGPVGIGIDNPQHELDVKGKIQGEGLVSSTIVKNVNAHENQPILFSGFYCHWNGITFDNCSGTNHSWGGVANIKTSTPKSEGNKLTVSFIDGYIGDPICNVSFENYIGHETHNTYSSGIDIYTYNVSGNPQEWSKINTWMYVMCFGAND